MLVDKINLYLTGSDQKLDEELVKQMWDSFSYSVKRQLMESREISTNLRGSNPGPCPRKMAYAHLGFEETEPLNARAKITFLTGDLLELVSIGLMRLAGINVTNTCLDEGGQGEAFFDAGNGILIPCHLDGIVEPQTGVTDVRRLLEVKSSSDYGFKRGWKREQISDQYLLQHNIYMDAFGLDYGVFFVINKNTGHMHEVLTEKDPEMIEWGKKNYRLAAESSPDNLPPRFFDYENYGPTKDKENKFTGKLAWGCSYCDFTRYCWPGLEVEIERGRPVNKISLPVIQTIQSKSDYVVRYGLKEDEPLNLFEN